MTRNAGRAQSVHTADPCNSVHERRYRAVQRRLGNSVLAVAAEAERDPATACGMPGVNGVPRAKMRREGCQAAGLRGDHRSLGARQRPAGFVMRRYGKNG